MRRHPKRAAVRHHWVDLLYEDAVPATGKLLFGEIYRLSGPDGWCDASNQDFMDLLGCSETTVRNLLKALEDVGRFGWSPGPAGKRWRHGGAGSSAAGNWPSRGPGCTRKKLRVPRGGTRRNLRGVPAETCGSTSISNYNNTPYSPPKGMTLTL